MPQPPTPQVTLGPSQLASSTPPTMARRRFTHNNGDMDLVPGGTRRCLEIGPTSTPVDALHPSVAALREELAGIPGVSGVNIMMRYVTIEADRSVSWAKIAEIVAAAFKRHFGWPVDPVIKTLKTTTAS